MVGFIFGILVLIAGLVTGICLSTYGVAETRLEGESWNQKEVPTGKILHPYRKYLSIVAIGGTVFAAILIFLGCLATVSTGSTGVITTFGKVDTNETLQSGFHLKAPWEKVTKIDTTVNELSINTPAYTNDSQTVELAITIQYSVSQAETFSLVDKYGISNTKTRLEDNFKNRVMTSAKNIIATKKADDLLTNRSSVVAELATDIDSFKDDYYIIISAVNLTNIDFTDEYEAAVAAKVSQQQAYEKALIEQQQALAQAENDKKIAETNAQADAAKAKIAAEAEAEVVKIQAEASEYQGKKESSIVLNRLAGINGWTVIYDETTSIYQLVKSDGTEVTETERAAGVEKLIEYYYTQTWNGTLPETYVGDDSVSSILIGGNN